MTETDGMQDPSASLAPTTDGNPSGWLGLNRYERLTVTPGELKSVTFRGVLRGVEAICLDRLARARELLVEEKGPGIYLVLNSTGDDFEWVNLIDRDIDERCHCHDQLFRAHRLKTPCKHILAALLAAKDPNVLELIADVDRRQLLAHALTKQVTDS